MPGLSAMARGDREQASNSPPWVETLCGVLTWRKLFHKSCPLLWAAGCVLTALIVRWSFTPTIGNDGAAFTIFVLAAMMACRYGGLSAGLAAMVGGEFLGDYFFVNPRLTLGPATPLEWTYLIFYFAATGTALWFIEAHRRARTRAERTALLAQSRGELLRTGMHEIQAAEGRIRELAKVIENSISRDVIERKRAEEALRDTESHLEQRVRERTAALESANRELEAFSYTVSHDLRAPLRSINGFTKAVLDDYQDQLDHRAVNYLRHVYDSSERMGEVMGDLLTLSRVSATELHYQSADVSRMASTILSDLQKHEPERQIEIKITPGIVVWADQGLLNIALENLLRNAWKYTSKVAQARIELASELQTEQIVLQVRDNGAGFDMGQADRLFKVFQRLHPAKDFPGTGVGLATVKRIVQRHGGSIWAEASVNQGATFFVALPLARENLPKAGATITQSF
jgi:signal transduction histidine kinase